MPPYNPNDQSGTINNTDWCASMKNRGVTIAVLYIPYQPIQNPNSAFANSEDTYANNNISSIPGALQSCASPNFYFTAMTPADITAALKQMFQQSLISAHVAQ